MAKKVEFHKRFDKHNILLKNTYESKKLGQPLYFNIEYSQKKIIPEKIFRKWVNKTNILQYLGIHYIDLVYFITKATPIRVLAMGQKNWLKKQKIPTLNFGSKLKFRRNFASACPIATSRPPDP